MRPAVIRLKSELPQRGSCDHPPQNNTAGGVSVKLFFELLKSDLTFIPEADKQFEPCTEACACSIKPLYSRAGYGTLSFML